MNVLEHIQDDRAVLAALKKLSPRGRIVVLVPAGQWAFGPADLRLGHYRRYTKRSARPLVAALQLELEAIRYYNFVASGAGGGTPESPAVSARATPRSASSIP